MYIFVENCWYLGDTIGASGGAFGKLRIRLKEPIGNWQVIGNWSFDVQ